MLSMIALAAGSAFAVAALVRLVRAVAVLRHLQLVAALVAALSGMATWQATGDSRWLVGGVLFLGAGLPGWLAGRRRGPAGAALIVGLLALALYGIATVHPMMRPA